MNPIQNLNLNLRLSDFNQRLNPVGLVFSDLDKSEKRVLDGIDYLVIATTPISELLLSKSTGEVLFFDEPTKSFVNSNLQHFVNCLNEWHNLLMRQKRMSDAESVRGAKAFLAFLTREDPKALSENTFWQNLANEVVEMHEELV